MKLDLQRFGGAEDQRDEFLKAASEFLPKLSLRIQQNRVLVGTYVQTVKTKGGIILPDKMLDESRFQGKVGIVLAMGPKAFCWVDGEPRADDAPKIGDWVFYRASDTWELGLGSGVPCRIIFDDCVVSPVDDPSLVW